MIGASVGRSLEKNYACVTKVLRTTDLASGPPPRRVQYSVTLPGDHVAAKSVGRFPRKGTTGARPSTLGQAGEAGYS